MNRPLRTIKTNASLSARAFARASPRYAGTLVIIIACTKQEARTAADLALTIGQLICLETQPSADVEVAQATCRIVSNPLTRDVISRLLSQREAAKHTGFAWSRAAVDHDAGTEAGSPNMQGVPIP